MPSLADMMRRRDPDRFFCALFAPAERREALFTLISFNDELSRALEIVSTPGLALIRLQWWREIVEGAARRHEVASPLRALLDSGALGAAPLLEMIAAREAEVEGAPATLADFVARMVEGPGALAVAAGGLLGADASELARLRRIGAAYGLAGTLRNVAAGGGVLPVDMDAPAVTAAGAELLGSPLGVRRAILAAALPGVLARRDLARAEPALVRGVGDRMAVVWAAACGVV